jgi:hypothetical protein
MNMPDQSTLIVLAVLVGGFLLAGKAIRRVGPIARLALTAVGLVVAIMIFGPFVENALAAETTPPVLTCGSTVEWSLTTTVGTPANAATALQSAWSQIEAATGVHDKKVNEASLFGSGGGKITWYWRYPMDGIGADPINEDNQAITEVTHQHVGDLSGTAVALPVLNQMLLQDLGRDFGLPAAIQGTGGRLTKADLSALDVLCATKKAAPAGSAAETPAPYGTQATVDAATPPAHLVTVTAREKVVGYGGAGVAGVVLALTLLGSRIRDLAGKRAHTLPSWSSIRDRIKGLLRRPSKA